MSEPKKIVVNEICKNCANFYVVEPDGILFKNPWPSCAKHLWDATWDGKTKCRHFKTREAKE